MRAALAVAGKELHVLAKDRGALAVLFLLPLVLASLFGSMSQAMSQASTGEKTVSLPIAVVNQDTGEYGAQVANTLVGISALDAKLADSVAAATSMVTDGSVLAAVIVPEDFSASVDAYRPSKVQVIIDPTKEQYSSLVTGIVNEVIGPVVLQGEIRYGVRTVMAAYPAFAQLSAEAQQAVQAQTLGVIMTQLQLQQQSPWIAVERRKLAGVEDKSAFNPYDYNIPSMTAMFAFFLVGVMAQSLWLEKEQGSFRRLLAAPISRGSIIAGKMLAYMLVVVLQVVVFFSVGGLVFGMSLGNSVAGLALITVTLAMSAAGLGMLLAAVTRNSRQADSLGIVLGFVLAAAGGCIFYPLFQLGGIVGFVSRLTPHAQALIGFWKLFDGAGIADVLPQAGALAAMGVAFFAVAMWRFRFE